MNNFIRGLYWQIINAFSILMLAFSLTANVTVSATVLSTGARHNCAIQADNTVVCWGGNRRGKATPPSGTFSQVSAGSNHTCGIRNDNTVACWGLNTQSKSPPSGTFSKISAGGNQTCGIKTDGSVVCWSGNKEREAPKGNFSQVSVGYAHICGIISDNNTVVCWGDDRNIYGQTLSVTGTLLPPTGTFSQVDACSTYSCGVRLDNTAVCWGWDPDSRASPPTDYHYYRISGSNNGDNYFSCGLKTDNTVVCFGPQDLSPSEGIRPPNSTCRCPYPGAKKNKPTLCACTSSSDNTFSQVDVGISHVCGVIPDNSVACWGYDREGEAMPPRGLMVKSSDPKACLLYGVYDDGKDTQFFIINSGTSEVHVRSRLGENYQIDALDTQPLSNQPYAASSDNTGEKGHIYQVRNGAQNLTDFGETDFREINALAFHPEGTLWGWAQDAGLFKIENGENNEPDINTVEVVLPYDREVGVVEVEVNDLTWNTAGTILYGIGRLLHKSQNPDDSLSPENKLWAYNASEGTVNTVCDNIMDSLDNVGAMETLPNDSLLFGFTRNDNLNFLEIDVQTCEIITQEKIATDYHNVKGLARPDCSHPYVDTASPR